MHSLRPPTQNISQVLEVSTFFDRLCQHCVTLPQASAQSERPMQISWQHLETQVCEIWVSVLIYSSGCRGGTGEIPACGCQLHVGLRLVRGSELQTAPPGWLSCQSLGPSCALITFPPLLSHGLPRAGQCTHRWQWSQVGATLEGSHLCGATECLWLEFYTPQPTVCSIMRELF